MNTTINYSGFIDLLDADNSDLDYFDLSGTSETYDSSDMEIKTEKTSSYVALSFEDF